MVSKEKKFLIICLLICQIVANMGVTNVVVTIFYDVFNGLFFDRKTITVFGGRSYCQYVADVIVTC